MEGLIEDTRTYSTYTTTTQYFSSSNTLALNITFSAIIELKWLMLGITVGLWCSTSFGLGMVALASLLFGEGFWSCVFINIVYIYARYKISGRFFLLDYPVLRI